MDVPGAYVKSRSADRETALLNSENPRLAQAACGKRNESDGESDQDVDDWKDHGFLRI